MPDYWFPAQLFKDKLSGSHQCSEEGKINAYPLIPCQINTKLKVRANEEVKKYGLPENRTEVLSHRFSRNWKY